MNEKGEFNSMKSFNNILEITEYLLKQNKESITIK